MEQQLLKQSLGKKGGSETKSFKKKRASQHTVNKSDCESSNVDEEEGEYSEEGDNDREGFICVPMNNLDIETVHIKVIEDEAKMK